MDLAGDHDGYARLRADGDPPKTAIQTFSGRTVDIARADPAAIAVEDVAHGLSLTCRYGGQSTHFYSVAEHAVLCWRLVRSRGGSEAEQRAALHHDDAEAYIGDVPSPMKPILGEPWALLEEDWNMAVAARWGLPSDMFDWELVEWADRFAVTIEGARLMPAPGWDWARDAGLELPAGIVWNCGLSAGMAEQLYLAAVDETEPRTIDA